MNMPMPPINPDRQVGGKTPTGQVSANQFQDTKPNMMPQQDNPMGTPSTEAPKSEFATDYNTKLMKKRSHRDDARPAAFDRTRTGFRQTGY